MENIKTIHIGSFIQKRVSESNIRITRICNFFDCGEKEINQIYMSPALNSDYLLKWCKLLDYDFFRLYSQHLILYSPPAPFKHPYVSKVKKSALPQFRKSIYTKEIIYFILKLIETNKKTKSQIIDDYKIPKTTLYKWIAKYKNSEDS
ncbi:transposase [Chryseobacterium sp.]|uniref:transposase n=1 Tax=Chryseobacterium sp. TaxID=1871047 RepID=UPI0026390114|nr:transposase [Chryseobacterium sp.]